MGPANAPLVMQGHHRHREAALWVIVLSAGQILLTGLHNAFFLFTVVIITKDKRFLHHRLCFS